MKTTPAKVQSAEVQAFKKIHKDPQKVGQFLGTRPRLQDALGKVAARMKGKKRKTQREFVDECVSDIMATKEVPPAPRKACMGTGDDLRKQASVIRTIHKKAGN